MCLCKLLSEEAIPKYGWEAPTLPVTLWMPLKWTDLTLHRDSVRVSVINVYLCSLWVPPLTHLFHTLPTHTVKTQTCTHTSLLHTHANTHRKHPVPSRSALEQHQQLIKQPISHLLWEQHSTRFAPYAASALCTTWFSGWNRRYDNHFKHTHLGSFNVLFIYPLKNITSHTNHIIPLLFLWVCISSQLWCELS